MAKTAKIDLIIHREGADCMVHSARTESNIALAPNTAQVDLAPLITARNAIENSLKGVAPISPVNLRAIGQQLADVLFAGGVRQVYDGAAADPLVQLSLCARDAGLKAIPWEFVVWPDLGIAPHDNRSICRLVECTTTRPIERLSLDDGIKVMLVVSQPTDAPAVEWIETRRQLETQIKANTPPEGAKRMEFELCETLTAAAVRKAVRGFDPHIVHFIGHGHPTGLVFTRHQSDESIEVPPETAYNILVSNSTRLVVLSACDTAATGTEIAPLIPIAEQLVRAGVPAVVANQMPISLRSIHAFCGALYDELLRHGNIDWAVNVGRIAMGVEFPSTQASAMVEWGVPVLYRRPGCSQLFEVPNP